VDIERGQYPPIQRNNQQTENLCAHELVMARGVYRRACKLGSVQHAVHYAAYSPERFRTFWSVWQVALGAPPAARGVDSQSNKLGARKEILQIFCRLSTGESWFVVRTAPLN
jgi:hypothetical protein